MGLRHGTRTGPQNDNPKNMFLFWNFRFLNSKIIGLFRCHWGGPKKVEQKNIHYVFVQAKNLFGQKSNN